jgi:hypothetical protein
MPRFLACPVPTNINPLSPNGFRFSVNRIPELTYFAQEIQLPQLSLPALGIANPFVNYPVTGESMTFDDFNIQFLVDSEMKNYIALFNWLRGLGFPETNKQYTDQIKTGMDYKLSENMASMSDSTLSILGNTNNVLQVVEFKDCVITSLSGLTFTTTATDVQYLVGVATFKYAYYDFLSL